jgi:hypothetical protein
MSSLRPHQSGAFLHDLLSELGQRGWPQYPSRPWWLALRLADERDLARALLSINE